MTTNNGIPKRVLRKALQLGIHNDCIVAGVTGACDICLANISLAFDFYYGSLGTTEDVMRAILVDLQADEGDEQ